MDRAGHVLGCLTISECGPCSTAVDVKLILQGTLLTNASGVVLAHNHPSGDLKPSTPDKVMTEKINKALAAMDFKLLDHLIVTALGCFTGLRISDILALRWEQILNAEEFTITEKKTGKRRTLRLNPQLQQRIKECYEHIQPIGIKAPILVSQKGTVFTIQRINVILKEVKKKYRLKIKNFRCHSLRKTFGRQVYTMSGDNAELALVKLMELFNHSSVAITKRY